MNTFLSMLAAYLRSNLQSQGKCVVWGKCLCNKDPLITVDDLDY